MVLLKQLLAMLGSLAGLILGGFAGFWGGYLMLLWFESGLGPEDEGGGPLFYIAFAAACIFIGAQIGFAVAMKLALSLAFPPSKIELPAADLIAGDDNFVHRD